MTIPYRWKLALVLALAAMSIGYWGLALKALGSQVSFSKDTSPDKPLNDLQQIGQISGVQFPLDARAVFVSYDKHPRMGDALLRAVIQLPAGSLDSFLAANQWDRGAFRSGADSLGPDYKAWDPNTRGPVPTYRPSPKPTDGGSSLTLGYRESADHVRLYLQWIKT